MNTLAATQYKHMHYTAHAQAAAQHKYAASKRAHSYTQRYAAQYTQEQLQRVATLQALVQEAYARATVYVNLRKQFATVKAYKTHTLDKCNVKAHKALQAYCVQHNVECVQTQTSMLFRIK